MKININKPIKSKAQKITCTAVLLAMAIALSIFESILAPLTFMIPGVKLGLSNIVTMYAVFYLDFKYAFFLACSKSMFVFITRGATAAALSLSGGIMSVSVIILLVFLFRKKISYILTSILGAVAHNLGQLIVLSLIMYTKYVFYYLPVLLISGVIMGIITGTILNAAAPALNRITDKGA